MLETNASVFNILFVMLNRPNRLYIFFYISVNLLHPSLLNLSR